MAALSAEKLLSQLGFGTRKECRSLVKCGAVRFDESIIEDPEAVIASIPESVEVNGERVAASTELYLMLNKPLGFECSFNPQRHDSVFSLLPARFINMQVRSAGRLDVDSSGLLLLSNQGDFIHRVESPKKGMLKHYVVTLSAPFDIEQRSRLEAGVMLNNEKSISVARDIRILAEGEIEIAIGEGSYHQVRRMFAAAGNHVQTLRRVAIGDVVLDDTLAPGEWRLLTDKELTSLKGA